MAEADGHTVRAPVFARPGALSAARRGSGGAGNFAGVMAWSGKAACRADPARPKHMELLSRTDLPVNGLVEQKNLLMEFGSRAFVGGEILFVEGKPPRRSWAIAAGGGRGRDGGEDAGEADRAVSRLPGDSGPGGCVRLPRGEAGWWDVKGPFPKALFRRGGVRLAVPGTRRFRARSGFRRSAHEEINREKMVSSSRLTWLPGPARLA